MKRESKKEAKPPRRARDRTGWDAMRCDGTRYNTGGWASEKGGGWASEQHAYVIMRGFSITTVRGDLEWHSTTREAGARY